MTAQQTEIRSEQFDLGLFIKTNGQNTFSSNQLASSFGYLSMTIKNLIMGPIKRIKPEAVQREHATNSNNLPPVTIAGLADLLNKTTIGDNNGSSGVRPKTSISAIFGDKTIGRVEDVNVKTVGDGNNGNTTEPTKQIGRIVPDLSQLNLEGHFGQMGSDGSDGSDEEEILHFPSTEQDTNGNIEQLQAVILDTKLPYPQSSQCVCYDGSDCVYIMGGWRTEDKEHYRNSTIYLFSISTHTIRQVGTLPKPSQNGISMLWSQNDGKNTTIFFFGGGNGRDVFKFYPDTKICSMVAELPYSVSHGSCLKANGDSNTVYIVGGNTRGNDCLAFDMESLTSRVMKEPSFCPYPTTAVRFDCGAVDKAFFYGGVFQRGQKTLHEFSMRNLKWRPVGHEQYPNINEIGKSVGDGRFVYLIGGYDVFDATSTFRTGGLTQFDPVTMKSRFIPVKNFPVDSSTSDDWLDRISGSNYCEAPDCVYVNGLNRIYFFGGRISDKGKNLVDVDDIFYIDLSSSSDPQ